MTQLQENTQTDERTSEWKDRWTDGRKDGQTDERKDDRMDSPYFVGPFQLLAGVQKRRHYLTNDLYKQKYQYKIRGKEGPNEIYFYSQSFF